MDQFINFFTAQLNEQEQCEVSVLLDRFMQMWENGFEDWVSDDTEREDLVHELSQLYDALQNWQGAAIEDMEDVSE